jgi:hypothetical protein
MKKSSMLLIASLMCLVGVNCFAQNMEARVRALQGEWLVVWIQIGDEILDFTQEPFNEAGEIIWIFQDNNFSQWVKNFQDNTSMIVLSGTFRIDAGNMIISYGGETEVFSFTLKSDTLIMHSKETMATVTCRKR